MDAEEISTPLAVGPSSPERPAPNRQDVAAAALARSGGPLNAEQEDQVQWGKDHELRQHFRRLVDPGIVRGNNDADAKACTETLLTICQNILDHPDEEKYRKFKRSNKMIQQKIVKPKGGLEFATEVGFREHVENLEQWYQWRPNSGNVTLLRVATFVLREHHERVAAREAQANTTKMTLKEIQEETARRVRLQYEDDRKQMAVRAEIERQNRAAVAANPPSRSPQLPGPPISPAQQESLKEE